MQYTFFNAVDNAAKKLQATAATVEIKGLKLLAAGAGMSRDKAGCLLALAKSMKAGHRHGRRPQGPCRRLTHYRRGWHGCTPRQ